MARRDPEKGRDRLERIMTQRLKEIKLGDRVVAEVSGPQLVLVNGENPREQKVDTGWQLTIWIEHEKLLGQPPIGVGLPVAGVLLAEELVDMLTTRLLEEGRRLRFEAERQAEQPEGIPSAEQMMAALRGNGQGPSA